MHDMIEWLVIDMSQGAQKCSIWNNCLSSKDRQNPAISQLGKDLG